MCVYIRTYVYVNTSGKHNCAHTLRCVLLQGGTYRVSLLCLAALLHDLLESRGAGSASHYGCATALNLLSAHSPDRQLVNRGRVRPCVHARGRELINTGAVHKIIKIKTLSAGGQSVPRPLVITCKKSSAVSCQTDRGIWQPRTSLLHSSAWNISVPLAQQNQSRR